MGKTVRQLLSEVTSKEITEWIAFFNLKNEGDPGSALGELRKMFSARIKKKGR